MRKWEFAVVSDRTELNIFTLNKRWFRSIVSSSRRWRLAFWFRNRLRKRQSFSVTKGNTGGAQRSGRGRRLGNGSTLSATPPALWASPRGLRQSPFCFFFVCLPFYFVLSLPISILPFCFFGALHLLAVSETAYVQRQRSSGSKVSSVPSCSRTFLHRPHKMPDFGQ